MEDCIFCKIVNRTIPTPLIYEDEEVVAFNDINPVAPVHILIIPRQHIQSVAHSAEEDEKTLGRLFVVARKIAQEQGLTEKGFRLVVNTGTDGGQTVFHLHMHLLAGRSMEWPPG
ncbi:histidine triad nucleotide-binding protein [Heliorestis acidaminivorans]|uniref:Histidine triad nucleotide-binding protein n=1 Tax=Heliorestis acidaminivorans TaxID=553427 RepID=A0A6I0F209_9FIRM|nr:histidine triad nucleotide-binding protein [Heliorestis acidaminivorans]KAB2952286.1 histidine triad nucleotide-binding protein [Heliorestis acidaminivorans]